MPAYARWLRLVVALLLWWSAAAPAHALARSEPGTAAFDDSGSQLRRPCLEAELGPDGHEAIRAPSCAPPRPEPSPPQSSSRVITSPRAPAIAPSRRVCDAPSCRGPPC